MKLTLIAILFLFSCGEPQLYPTLAEDTSVVYKLPDTLRGETFRYDPYGYLATIIVDDSIYPMPKGARLMKITPIKMYKTTFTIGVSNGIDTRFFYKMAPTYFDRERVTRIQVFLGKAQIDYILPATKPEIENVHKHHNHDTDTLRTRRQLRH
jgi:hypothetical protein